MNQPRTTLALVLSSLVLAAGCGSQADAGANLGVVLSGSEFATDAPRIARGPLPRPEVRPHCRHSPSSVVPTSERRRALPLCLRRSLPSQHGAPAG
jgi:hypothetical protein